MAVRDGTDSRTFVRRSRRMVLGYVNVVTPEQARRIAIQHLAALRVDPLAERDGGRDAVTMKDLAARFVPSTSPCT